MAGLACSVLSFLKRDAKELVEQAIFTDTEIVHDALEGKISKLGPRDSWVKLGEARQRIATRVLQGITPEQNL